MEEAAQLQRQIEALEASHARQQAEERTKATKRQTTVTKEFNLSTPRRRLG